MGDMCCEAMRYFSSNHCPVHHSPFECPDWLVLFDETSNDYGIIVHDGGQSVVTIQYCPWCGSLLSPKEGSSERKSEGDNSR